MKITINLDLQFDVKLISQKIEVSDEEIKSEIEEYIWTILSREFNDDHDEFTIGHEIIHPPKPGLMGIYLGPQTEYIYNEYQITLDIDED